MTTYRVYYEVTSAAHIDIEANSLEEAILISETMDNPRFVVTDPTWSFDPYTYEHEYYEEDKSE